MINLKVAEKDDVSLVAQRKALEKVDFSNEGIMRKSWYVRGEYRDMYLYSILREKWKEPKILAVKSNDSSFV